MKLTIIQAAAPRIILKSWVLIIPAPEFIVAVALLNTTNPTAVSIPTKKNKTISNFERILIPLTLLNNSIHISPVPIIPNYPVTCNYFCNLPRGVFKKTRLVKAVS